MIFRTGVIDSTWASCQSLRNIPDSFKKIGFIRLRVLERVQVEELKTIRKINIADMQRMDGIAMIQDSHCRYMMKMERLNVTTYLVPDF